MMWMVEFRDGLRRSTTFLAARDFTFMTAITATFADVQARLELTFDLRAHHT